MTIKKASEVQAGDVLVTRPNPEALTADVQPTSYTLIEQVETFTNKYGPDVMVSLFLRPKRSMGRACHFDGKDKVEVSDIFTESCIVLPDGRVLA